MTEPKAYTSAELTKQFLDHIHSITRYWAALPDQDNLERCERVAFSILTMLDGATGLPAFDVVARPHPTDKDDHIEKGDGWIEDGTVLEPSLHEKFYRQPQTSEK